MRFAENSRSAALNELPIQRPKKSSLADRRGVDVGGLIESGRRYKPRRSRTRQPSVSSNEASWFLTLPAKIQKKQFTREEQVILTARLRESVILDAADEAIYKRRPEHIPPLDKLPLTPITLDSSMESPRTVEHDSTSSMQAAMYESFRWMDEEKDLDLKLVLDDYHANLDGAVVPAPNSIRRPSFRRNMSISKIPFGRSSLSSPRSPKFEPMVMNPNRPGHKARSLSLIQNKHQPKDSISIDPNAAHYQDPEARLKLRVYLASPSKFDEAIEFGFPSMDGITAEADKENKPPTRKSRDTHTNKKSSSTEKSFLNDDTASLFEDDNSLIEPDSPLTPMGDLSFRPDRNYQPLHSSLPQSSKSNTNSNPNSSDFSHLGITKPMLIKQSGEYAQAMAGNREMTLRMTLTRPDLRADDNMIYGWQNKEKDLEKEKEKEREGVPPMDEKFDVKGPFGGPDGWGPPEEREEGVVKRIWNRVKSSGAQRKAS